MAALVEKLNPEPIFEPSQKQFETHLRCFDLPLGRIFVHSGLKNDFQRSLPVNDL